MKTQVAKRKLGMCWCWRAKRRYESAGGMCDAIFLRHVYHHLTKPAEFDASLVRSTEAGRAAGDMIFRRARAGSG